MSDVIERIFERGRECVGLLGKRGLPALLSDVAPSVCPFWFS